MMKLMLQKWFRVADTSEDEGLDLRGSLDAFDSDSMAWVISFACHLLALLAVALVFIPLPLSQDEIALVIPLTEDLTLEETVEFDSSHDVVDEVGAATVRGDESAWSEAPIQADASVVPTLDILPESDAATVALVEDIQEATGEHFNETLTVPGASGVGTTGAMGAIDRITHEILLNLERRKVLVVWLFDQSGSLQQQRDRLVQRFDRVYAELGVVAAAKNSYARRYKDQPLLTSIVSFGKEVTLRTEIPTDDLGQLKEAIAGIQWDDSGVERVFSAIYTSADAYKKFRRIERKTGEPMRNIMFVVMTDEVGDDQEMLERSIEICRRWAIPVYVVGVPAPFGRQDTLVKWVDPDPNYDQSPQWGQVAQGPESYLLERIKLHIPGLHEETAPLDSGFGPFALTRLCYETGGIFFAVHPNRNSRRHVSRGETENYSAYLQRFFDPTVMRKYRPDYVSEQVYLRRLQDNAARSSLVEAARMSWVESFERARLRFPKRSEADLANLLTEAQKQAAKLEPKVNLLYERLKPGEVARDKESSPRWQAGYDLAMGRVLAVKVRTEAYNAMLAKAKRGMKFQNEVNDTWILRHDDEVSVGSQLRKLADKSRMYLQRVVNEHPSTPWAMLAEKELSVALGWKWAEQHTGVNDPPRQPANNGNAPPPRDDQIRNLPRPKPRRAPPRL